jgi:hypothetical protein
MPAVMIDTCVWVDALRGRTPSAVGTLRRLLLGDRAVRCDVVTAELRYGLRSHERERVLGNFAAVPSLAVAPEDWEAAGDLGAGLRRQGVTLPLTDLLIARVCLRAGIELYTHDGHFRAIDGLRLYTAESGADPAR